MASCVYGANRKFYLDSTFARISVDLAKFGMKTALLVSGLKAAERREILKVFLAVILI